MDSNKNGLQYYSVCRILHPGPQRRHPHTTKLPQTFEKRPQTRFYTSDVDFYTLNHKKCRTLQFQCRIKLLCLFCVTFSEPCCSCVVLGCLFCGPGCRILHPGPQNRHPKTTKLPQDSQKLRQNNHKNEILHRTCRIRRFCGPVCSILHRECRI